MSSGSVQDPSKVAKIKVVPFDGNSDRFRAWKRDFIAGLLKYRIAEVLSPISTFKTIIKQTPTETSKVSAASSSDAAKASDASKKEERVIEQTDVLLKFYRLKIVTVAKSGDDFNRHITGVLSVYEALINSLPSNVKNIVLPGLLNCTMNGSKEEDSYALQCPHPADVWSALNEEYQKFTPLHVRALHDKLTRLKMRGESYNDFTTLRAELNDTCERLMEMDEVVPKKEMLSRLLAALPKSADAVVTQLDFDKTTTFDSACEKLALYFSRQQQRQKNEESEKPTQIALFTKTRGHFNRPPMRGGRGRMRGRGGMRGARVWRPKPPYQRPIDHNKQPDNNNHNNNNSKPLFQRKTCSYCKKPGHTDDQCYFKHPNLKGKKRSTFRPNVASYGPRCRFCHRTNHVEKDCYDKKRYDSKDKVANNESAMVSLLDVVKDDENNNNNKATDELTQIGMFSVAKEGGGDNDKDDDDESDDQREASKELRDMEASNAEKRLTKSLKKDAKFSDDEEFEQYNQDIWRENQVIEREERHKRRERAKEQEEQGRAEAEEWIAAQEAAQEAMPPLEKPSEEEEDADRDAIHAKDEAPAAPIANCAQPQLLHMSKTSRELNLPMPPLEKPNAEPSPAPYRQTREEIERDEREIKALMFKKKREDISIEMRDQLLSEDREIMHTEMFKKPQPRKPKRKMKPEEEESEFLSKRFKDEKSGLFYQWNLRNSRRLYLVSDDDEDDDETDKKHITDKNNNNKKDDDDNNASVIGVVRIMRSLRDRTPNSKKPHIAARFVIDSGAPFHVCNDKHMFKRLSYYAKPVKLTGFSKKCGITEVHGEGMLGLVVDISGKAEKLNLPLVYYVPDSHINIISQVAIERSGYDYRNVRGDSTCNWRAFSNGNVALEAKYVGDRLMLNLHKAPQTQQELARKIIATITPISLNLWHRRLGHAGAQAIRTLASSDSAASEFNVMDEVVECDVCKQAKAQHKPFNDAENRASEALERVHIDLAGPLTTSTNGFRYYLIVVDDASRHVETYFLREKSAALTAFEHYVTFWQKNKQKKVKILRSDNGGEFTSNDFNEFCLQNGIRREKTIPYTPQQNGVAERTIRTINTYARAMMIESGLPEDRWTEAVREAAAVRNVIPHTSLAGKPPNEVWNGTASDMSMWRVFGCEAWVKVDNKNKFGARAVRGVHLGMERERKAYRILVLETKPEKIISARDVEFRENVFPFRAATNNNNNKPAQQPTHQQQNNPQPQPHTQPSSDHPSLIEWGRPRHDEVKESRLSTPGKEQTILPPELPPALQHNVLAEPDVGQSHVPPLKHGVGQGCDPLQSGASHDDEHKRQDMGSSHVRSDIAHAGEGGAMPSDNAEQLHGVLMRKSITPLLPSSTQVRARANKEDDSSSQ